MELSKFKHIIDIINHVKKRSKQLNTNFELYERVQNLLNDELVSKNK